MPNLNTAQFTLTGMTAKRSLGDRLEDRWLSPKDFGATGLGVVDDSAAFNAYFDYAFGAYGSEHGESIRSEPGCLHSSRPIQNLAAAQAQ